MRFLYSIISVLIAINLSTGATAGESIWETRLIEDASREPFTLTARKANYFLFTYQDEPNREPYVATGEADKLKSEEIKYQLSFQTKMADDLFGENGDLWFGYTQVAFWQLFSSDISAPFRETNYEPEVYLSFITDVPLPGLTLRGLNIGFVHQSNGRSQTLSRSWNRIYMEFQFVHDDFALSIKPWYRIKESAEDDDNPDIEDYLGHYELRAYYHWDSHVFSAILRNVFDSDHRQNTELNWTFPISKRLRGLVQFYNGYGESLIDYRHDSTRIGVGVMMTDWL